MGSPKGAQQPLSPLQTPRGALQHIQPSAGTEPRGHGPWMAAGLVTGSLAVSACPCREQLQKM